MFGIANQFANSPRVTTMRRLTVSASGTAVRMLTGSSASLMWRAKANPSNLGQTLLMSSSVANLDFPLAAGDDTGWNPGNLMDYWFTGYSPNDIIHLWEMH